MAQIVQVSLLEPPPGLPRWRTLKKSKLHKKAPELLSATWTSFPADTQPWNWTGEVLKDVLMTHLEDLPTQVKELATKPIPPTELYGRKAEAESH